MERPARWWRIALFVALVVPLSWYSWLLGYAQQPGNSGINPLGPLVAALIVSSAAGWGGFKAYAGRIVRVRTSWTTYVAALLLPVVLAVGAVAIAVGLGAHFPAAEAAGRWKESVDAFLFMLLFVALGEEPGWRGWLLPALSRRFGPLGGALAVAPVWAVWHLPMWGRQVPFDQIGPFLISLTAGSVVLAWLTNRTRGGVLPAMLCHATVNTAGGGFLFSFFAGAAKTQLWWINAMLWAVAAAILGIATRGELGAQAADDEPSFARTRPA